MKNNISLLVKPTHMCNLSCTYCYDKIELKKHGCSTMSFDTLADLAKKLSITAKNINWIWHGGEPLTMGESWYRKAHDIIYKYIDKSRIRFSMQSNGVLLLNNNNDWLKDLNISVGVSYDFANNNESRLGNYDKIELLNYIRDNRLGTISVIDYEASFKLIEIYEEQKEKTKNFSLNAIFIKDDNGDMYNDINIYIENWKKYITHVIYDNNNKDMVSERGAIEFVKLVMGNKDLVCVNTNCIGNWLGIGPTGDIYNCDRHFGDNYKFCTLSDIKYSLLEVFEKDNFIKFENDFKESREWCYNNCEIFEFCKGGCPANRIPMNNTISKIDKDTCKIRKELIIHTFNIMKNLKAEDMYRLNPIVHKIIWKDGYMSLDTIEKVKKEVVI